jgi:hypothetical protein
MQRTVDFTDAVLTEIALLIGKAHVNRVLFVEIGAKQHGINTHVGQDVFINGIWICVPVDDGFVCEGSFDGRRRRRRRRRRWPSWRSRNSWKDLKSWKTWQNRRSRRS